ncbi:MAG: alpha/beta hydrolase [Atopobiaceae bacterium]|jgi:acetyl esterase/lipase|nr:alpha/beta hydrolase [Atopobiaceae bacterium]MCH4119534.1 alpha/beta hydrolase [Atopobiaceae bacterium]MCI1317906.1 alpha/beta hydrolase [Atopobiaceae bacterium]MCI1389581.1 alpha/beta hydrolase [Atopobiaceae bacterium]MCI1431645.1 alpha/beta hydrolase [Atopobiaceae bacterium]
MARTYDEGLVGRIEKGVRHIDVDGLDVELRPIPDDDREHVLDPRVLELTLKKLHGAVTVVAMDDVIAMRSRPNKETHPIDDGHVTETRQIMYLEGRGIPLHLFRPDGLEGLAPVFLFIHGGGFSSGIIAGYVNAMRYLAQECGAVVAYPEYRLAPECPFPAAVDDCVDTLRWLGAHAEELGLDMVRLGIGGDSAGGSLTNAVVQVLQAEIPAKLVVDIYPVLDCNPDTRLTGFSYDKYPVIDEQREAAKMRVDRIKDSKVEPLYTLNDVSKLSGPLISAAYASDDVLRGFPRFVMVDSEYDYLRIQDEAFAKRMSGLGVDVRCIRYAGCDHGWLESTGVMPQGEDLCRVIAQEMRAIEG